MNQFEHFSDSELEELKKVFYTQAYEILEELQDAMLKLEANPEDEDTLKEIQRYFHTLKGDSNSLGLTRVGALCHRVEDILTSLRDKARVIDSDTIGLLLNCVDTIDNLLRTHESGQNDDDLTKEIMKRVEAFLESEGGSVSPLSVKGRREPSLALKEPTEYQQLLMEKALAEGMKLFQAEVTLHPVCADKGVAAYMVGQKISLLGQIISSYPDLSGEEIEKADRFTIFFGAKTGQEEIREKIFIPGVTGEVNIQSYVPPVITPQAVAPVVSPDKAALPERRAGTPLSSLQKGLLRIEVSRVDKIMNLVGELIIGRSIIDQIAKDLAEKHSLDDLETRLFAVNSYLERNISDLQRGVMKMRMVPINHAFRKFPKVMRDLAAEKGKLVLLQIFGKETELDKGIVDAIGEPLAHIIRNCIDHGIEDPSIRKSLGKPEEGTITLKAYHEAAQIVIEAADDGRGIDLDKLKQKAVEKGFFAVEEVERLSEAEALNLIFFSGLSTSEMVSDISGRGIGMDAVKSVVQSLKGSVEIESTLGKGTRFRLRLPLTLAVIKALLFEVGEKLYAVPMSVIAEVTRVVKKDLTTIEGRETLRLRNQIISVIHLQEVFKTRGKDQEKKFVLIIGLGKRKIGLLVDHLLGQQELVIKAIDTNYAQSGLVAGASILGSGKVVLILDALAIFKKAIDDERKRMMAV